MIEDSMGQSCRSKPMYRYFLAIAVTFITLLLAANILAQKIISIWTFNVTAAAIIYPMTYVISDTITEVYGYAYLRQVIWMALYANVVMALLLEAGILLPSASIYHEQPAFAAILGHTPQIVIASLVSYLFGEFINGFFLSKLKVLTEGKHLWMRTIASTSIGQAVDTIIFTFIAFYGIFSFKQMQGLMIAVYVSKVLYAIIATPLIYGLSSFLKQREQVDAFDTDVHFNPFSLSR